MTPPPAMVALINVSNSSSPLNTNRLVISGGPVPQRRLDLNNRSDINGYKNILLHRTGISNSYSFGKAMNLRG